MNRPTVRSVERQAIRMHQMMERLNVDASAFIRIRGGETYVEARARCLLCSDICDCLHWLDGYYGEEGSPDFCPNLQVFAACRRDIHAV